MTLRSLEKCSDSIPFYMKSNFFYKKGMMVLNDKQVLLLGVSCELFKQFDAFWYYGKMKSPICSATKVIELI
jgi:hypothetical protein